MKDLIAKLQLDANCALGAIWLHIDAQAKRIAELEAQIAALGPEPEWIDSRNDDPAEASFWRFDARKKGYNRWKGAPQSERDAFKAEYRAAISTAGQAPVREVPANTHKFITSTSLIDLRGDLAVAAALGESIILSPENMKAILHAMRTGYPLPAAPVQKG